MRRLVRSTGRGSEEFLALQLARPGAARRPETAVALTNLAAVQVAEGDLVCTRVSLEKVQRIVRSALPPGHPNIYLTSHHLGQVLAMQGHQDADQAASRQKRLTSVNGKKEELERRLSRASEPYRLSGELDRTEPADRAVRLAAGSAVTGLVV